MAAVFWSVCPVTPLFFGIVLYPQSLLEGNFFLAMPRCLRDLSSLTRDCTRVPAVKAPGPNHRPAREFPTIPAEGTCPGSHVNALSLEWAGTLGTEVDPGQPRC